ncbi:MAG: hypothetical protein KatS3mg108_3669 [Isosphaeraceae bacterium]|nr:MAG: hypothetical protein KatS3mg108_3669 [Isosphaeraceae bacterium]
MAWRWVGLVVVVAGGWGHASGQEAGRVEVLFDGTTLDAWVVPDGDGGHWRIVEQDGERVIDYDARSEAPGDKNLVSRKEYGDFVLSLDWRIKETPYINPNVAYVLPDGTHARGVDGKPLALALPDSDSGIYLRDRNGKSQVNIWCWPIGSGEVYGYRMDRSMPAEVRAAVTPRHQADRPVGQWNHFDITLRGDRLTVVLNGVTVIENAQLPGIPARGPICLQHHGGYDEASGRYTGPPSLVQFKNIVIREL